ncbi:hypothetical protein AD944_00785 [Acetobacter tropicalis]|nr:hypothetical protein AD944_00785 [Acetobacter tropicalis]
MMLFLIQKITFGYLHTYIKEKMVPMGFGELSYILELLQTAHKAYLHMLILKLKIWGQLVLT